MTHSCNIARIQDSPILQVSMSNGDCFHQTAVPQGLDQVDTYLRIVFEPGYGQEMERIDKTGLRSAQFHSHSLLTPPAHDAFRRSSLM